MSFYPKKINKIPANNNGGTDYAVGDIHGCFSKLLETLEAINFDKTKDRLFCVGDLCDRGPESRDVLNFLENDWVYTTFGNHEQILFLYEGKIIDETQLNNVGAGWWLKTSREEKDKILEKFKSLPIAMELNTKAGRVGILHGECPVADWDLLEKSLTGLNGNKFIDKILWGSGSPDNRYKFKNIDAIVVGHMTQATYFKAGNVHLLDTGAVYPQGFFTIFNLDTLTPVAYFK